MELLIGTFRVINLQWLSEVCGYWQELRRAACVAIQSADCAGCARTQRFQLPRIGLRPLQHGAVRNKESHAWAFWSRFLVRSCAVGWMFCQVRRDKRGQGARWWNELKDWWILIPAARKLTGNAVKVLIVTNQNSINYCIFNQHLLVGKNYIYILHIYFVSVPLNS